VEMPVYDFHGQPYLRFSFQAYNNESDLNTAIGALRHIFAR
jgi:hypothetical protein